MGAGCLDMRAPRLGVRGAGPVAGIRRKKVRQAAYMVPLSRKRKQTST